MPDYLAVALQDATARHLNSDLVGAIDTGAAQRIDQLGMGHDTGAAPVELDIDALENLNVPADTVQQQRENSPAMDPPTIKALPLVPWLAFTPSVPHFFG